MSHVIRTFASATATYCLEGRFRQGVNLRGPRSEPVRGARG